MHFTRGWIRLDLLIHVFALQHKYVRGLCNVVIAATLIHNSILKISEIRNHAIK